MELKDFIQAELDLVKEATMRAVDGLSHHELMWQPGSEANSIGLILFHSARSEDLFIQTRIQSKPQIWESEKWYQKLNLPVSELPLSETSPGYMVKQGIVFPVPELRDLMAYADAVRNRTLDYLKGMTPDEFDKIINVPHRGDITIGWYLALMIVHLAQHAGEISYLRGMQRGMNK